VGFSSKGANDAGAKQNKTITTYAVRKPLIKLGVTPRKLLAILNDDGSDVRRNETADFENNKQVGSTRVKCSDSCDFFVAKVCELSPLGGVSTCAQVYLTRHLVRPTFFCNAVKSFGIKENKTTNLNLARCKESRIAVCTTCKSVH